MANCEYHTLKALELSDKLLDLADDQASDCGHDKCLILDGILRDCAYRIRKGAESSSEALGCPNLDDTERPAGAGRIARNSSAHGITAS